MIWFNFFWIEDESELVSGFNLEYYRIIYLYFFIRIYKFIIYYLLFRRIILVIIFWYRFLNWNILFNLLNMINLILLVIIQRILARIRYDYLIYIYILNNNIYINKYK